MSFKFALVGNPNCGKTTMFNEVTGSTQHVGNWPGVTVEKKEGKARRFKEDIRVIDLPGIYSLSPYSLEEIISRNYILEEKPDVVINIVDATNIERNLYLTTQLIELGIPVVVALNMMDALESRGDQIDIPRLEKQLGVPVIPTSANKAQGTKELIEKSLQVAQSAATGQLGESITIFDEQIKKSLDELLSFITPQCNQVYPPRFATVKLLEGDEIVIAKLQPNSAFMALITTTRGRLEQEYDNDMETIVADQRYQFISKVISKSVKKKLSVGGLTVSDKIDKILTHRILAIPLFLLVMYVVFTITFGFIGTFTIDYIDHLINVTLADAVTTLLHSAGAAEWLDSLIVGGIIAGLGSILVFVPQIMILFFFLAILEDSGYMSRAAFMMDRLLRKIGLSGKSFIPMIMGIGCSVPAIMATRTLENEKDRRLTIILTPFMSCGARLPVYALFAAAFFANAQSLVIFSLYILGMVVAILSGILLRKTLFKGEAEAFVMELPPYRIPTIKGLMIHMWDKGKGFIKKAGTVIFAASVIIWFGQTFDFSLHMVEEVSDSIFGSVGAFIAPFFAPLGFGDWRSSVALLTGFVAKEAVVATMGILNNLGEVGEGSVELMASLQTYFTPLKAYAFMTFTLLYMPCIAAFAAIKREMNSWKWTLFTVGYQTGTAWIVSFIVYQGGKLLGLG
ncbi:ferrous iron transport protein B [Paenibacillus glacialis]|uniref:Ferrous iron transport protein B n=1 Tax=Paenibacillus glacialis TaxID=494026 RepID=A0A168NS33_9BACL|nr:ferrous iron transport protein B [Paenibacillus glacialis]OAB46071.1 ferrous iron transporter B [Paenibacillus glacialis]